MESSSGVAGLAVVRHDGPSGHPTGKKAPFSDRDPYVFCIGPDRVMVANGGYPSFVGMSVQILKDADGKPLGKALVETGSREGGGSVEYPHINPASHKPEP